MKLITKNKKAYFDYEIFDSWEAGICLDGHEVKSIRAGNVNLKGNYVIFKNKELFIKDMYIAPWKALSNKDSLVSKIERKLLIHKKDIIKLSSKIKEKGFSLVGLELYFKGSLIKLKLGLVKGKKQFEKKQILKERTLDKEANKLMKKYY